MEPLQGSHCRYISFVDESGYVFTRPRHIAERPTYRPMIKNTLRATVLRMLLQLLDLTEENLHLIVFRFVRRFAQQLLTFTSKYPLP